jgi:hypothetical protein
MGHLNILDKVKDIDDPKEGMKQVLAFLMAGQLMNIQ